MMPVEVYRSGDHFIECNVVSIRMERQLSLGDNLDASKLRRIELAEQ